MRRKLIVALRIYVAAFAVFTGAATVVQILDPSAGYSEPPYPARAKILPRAIGHMVIAAAALVASAGLRTGKAYPLVALPLVAGIAWFGYDMLAVTTRQPFLGALATIAVVFPAYVAPLCGAVWLSARARAA